MLGYVKCHKPNLRICDYETYKSIYCSLCRTMGKRYGRLTRLALSYDFAFLAVLGLALQKESCEFQTKVCVCNPLKRCRYCCSQTDVLNYCSGAAVILLYFKFKDDVRDKSFLSSLPARFALGYLKSKVKRAKQDYPQAWDVIHAQSQRQSTLEQENCSGIDQATDPTAMMLAELISVFAQNEQQKRILSRLGYCLGRWVYLIDAVDDLHKDFKKTNYNPLITSGLVKNICEISNHQEQMEQMLTVCISEVAVAYMLLQPNRFSEIIENVLYQGLQSVQNSILKKRNEACERSV